MAQRNRPTIGDHRDTGTPEVASAGSVPVTRRCPATVLSLLAGVIIVISVVA
jgi:hypothetical protein